MKLSSCVGETDQLLPRGPGSIKSHYDFLVYAKTSWLIVFFIEENDIRYLYTIAHFPRDQKLELYRYIYISLQQQQQKLVYFQSNINF